MTERMRASVGSKLGMLHCALRAPYTHLLLDHPELSMAAEKIQQGKTQFTQRATVGILGEVLGFKLKALRLLGFFLNTHIRARCLSTSLSRLKSSGLWGSVHASSYQSPLIPFYHGSGPHNGIPPHAIPLGTHCVVPFSANDCTHVCSHRGMRYAFS